jgi:hypothetical protein
MNARLASAVLALATAIAIAGEDSLAAEHRKKAQPELQPDPARPANPTDNLPSASGAQTTTPAGAVTGAGQPQGGVLKERRAQPALLASVQPVVVGPKPRTPLRASRSAGRAKDHGTGL